MALATTMVFEVRNGGSDSQCSGGFNAARGGFDYTLQGAAQATGTVTSATTTVTATTAIFTSNMVGNTITDGTIIKEITAFTSSTVVTVDSAPSWTSATIYVGGAFASLGKAAASTTLAGHVVFVKYNATAFSATTASTNVTNGCVSGLAATTFCGYNTTRTLGNTDTLRPIFQANVSAATLFGGGNIYTIRNFVIDGNTQTTSIGVSTKGYIYNCLVKNCTSSAILDGGSAGAAAAYACEATSNSGTAFNAINTYWCEAHANSGAVFSSCAVCTGCISYANTGTFDGFVNCKTLINCVSYNNGRDGFRWNSNNADYFCFNCVAEGNIAATAYGFNSAASSAILTLTNCATYNNTTARSTTLGVAILDIGSITQTAGSYFTNAGSGNFLPNNTAGQGLLLQAVGFPATFPAGTTTSFGDVGVSQHQNPASSGGGNSIIG